MLYNVQLIKHAAISEEHISNICSLKVIRWNYSLDEHRQWIKLNLKADDLHIIISYEETILAYTNLIDITAIINSKKIRLKGIGNVCTRESGKNYGNILMTEVNNILEQRFWKGLLLCKASLVTYYEKFKWSLIDSDVVKQPNDASIVYMSFNFESKIFSFEFDGVNF
jgi:hypothetical protein